MQKGLAFFRFFLISGLGCALAAANPAPAPVLQSPAPGATNVDPDPTLSWRWVDDLVNNGSFETGLAPGWYTGGTYPNVWRPFYDTINRYGMGYCWATTYMPAVSRATAQLYQDFYVPADATSATLQWSERIYNLYYTPPQSQAIGKLRIWLSQGGTVVASLENATGLEPSFSAHTWVTRSTNLLAFAGQSLQLTVQADSYAVIASTEWYADVDGFSFSCEHPSAPPEFQVYVGRTSTLHSTDLVCDTSEMSFASIPLDSSTTYYWRVGAVRDGVTNYSSTAAFRTGQRVLPQITVTGQSGTSVRLSFPTRTNRYYTVEQADTPKGDWYALLPLGLGTGSSMEVDVPVPSGDSAFWRLRVDP